MLAVIVERVTPSPITIVAPNKRRPNRVVGSVLPKEGFIASQMSICRKLHRRRHAVKERELTKAHKDTHCEIKGISDSHPLNIPTSIKVGFFV
jgi:hypothetical protein